MKDNKIRQINKALCIDSIQIFANELYTLFWCVRNADLLLPLKGMTKRSRIRAISYLERAVSSTADMDSWQLPLLATVPYPHPVGF